MDTYGDDKSITDGFQRGQLKKKRKREKEERRKMSGQ